VPCRKKLELINGRVSITSKHGGIFEYLRGPYVVHPCAAAFMAGLLKFSYAASFGDLGVIHKVTSSRCESREIKHP
jgi:hypothetical protein